MPGMMPDSLQYAPAQAQGAYLDAQFASMLKANQAQAAAEKAQQQQATTPLAPHQELIQRASNPPQHVTTSYLDDIVNFADSVAHDGGWGEAATRVGRDAAAGVADAAVNTGDAVVGAVQDEVKGLTSPREAALEAEDPAMANRMKFLGENAPPSIWEHAKNAILDFRDAVAVKDPNVVDRLAQTTAQLALPFAGYSKLLEGLQLSTLGFDTAEGISATQGFGSYLAKTALNDAGKFAQKVVLPGAATDATALAPHAPRFADMIALGKQTDHKFVTALNTLDPTGGGVNAYINYLTDRSDESEAEGRFKNVLDGLAVNSIATPLFAAVGSVLKQGGAGLRYLIGNGMASANDLRRPFAQPKPGWADVSSSKNNPVAAPSEVALPEDALASPEAPITVPKGWDVGGGETDSAGMVRYSYAKSELNQVPTLDAFRGDLKSRAVATPAANVGIGMGHDAPLGKLTDVVSSLAKSLPENGEGAFYREVLGRVLKKGTDADFYASAVERPNNPASGLYNGIRNDVTVYPSAMKNNARLTHVVTHEAVHAVVYDDIAHNPRAAKAIDAVRQMIANPINEHNEAIMADRRAGNVGAGSLRATHYGLTNTQEFVAEAESNPHFRSVLLSTKGPDGRSVWEHYKDAIAGILGVSGVVAASPMFDRLLIKEKGKPGA